VFLFAIVAGLPVALWKGKPVYRATAVIYISPSVTRNPTDDRERDGGAYTTYVHQQAQNLLRRGVLETAMQKMSAAGIVWQRPGESAQSAVDRLHESLDVQHAPETYQLEVSITGVKRSGLPIVANSVVRAYLESVSSDGELGMQEKLTALREERDRVSEALSKKTSEQALLTQPLSAATFSSETALPEDKRATEAKTQLAEARERRREAAAQLQMFEKLGTTDSKAGVSPEEEALRARLTELNTQETQLETHLSELRARDMGPSHPVRQSEEQDLRRVQQQRAQAEAEARKKTHARLQAELERAEQAERDLMAEVAAQDAQLPGLAKTYYQAIEGSGIIAGLRQRMTALDERIAALELEGKSPGSIRLFADAIPPITPYKGGLKKMLLGLTIAALLLALAAMFATDLLLQPVHSAGEVEAILGFSPVGVLLHSNPVTQEFAYEQFLRFVGGIERARHTLGAHTFAITPLQAGSSVSELIARLGSELKKRGVDVLIVEANAFEFNATGSSIAPSGLGEMLAYGTADWRNIERGEGGAADRLRLGRTYGEPRLPDIGRLKDVLPQLAARYEIVLVEAPPLLVSADAEHLVSVCDATLLVVDSALDSKKDIKKATEKLRYLRPDRIGAILANLDLGKGESALIREAKQYNRARQHARERLQLTA
jgi:hypothetical protein